MAQEDRSYNGLEITGGPWFDEADELDLGAELLDDELAGLEADGNAGCFDGLDFIGDVGRDPIGLAND